LGKNCRERKFPKEDYGFRNAYYLLSRLLQFGAGAELLEPASLRAKILEAAQELVDTYATGG